MKRRHSRTAKPTNLPVVTLPVVTPVLINASKPQQQPEADGGERLDMTLTRATSRLAPYDSVALLPSVPEYSGRSRSQGMCPAQQIRWQISTPPPPPITRQCVQFQCQNFQKLLVFLEPDMRIREDVLRNEYLCRVDLSRSTFRPVKVAQQMGSMRTGDVCC